MSVDKHFFDAYDQNQHELSQLASAPMQANQAKGNYDQQVIIVGQGAAALAQQQNKYKSWHEKHEKLEKGRGITNLFSSKKKQEKKLSLYQSGVDEASTVLSGAKSSLESYRQSCNAAQFNLNKYNQLCTTVYKQRELVVGNFGQGHPLSVGLNNLVRDLRNIEADLNINNELCTTTKNIYGVYSQALDAFQRAIRKNKAARMKNTVATVEAFSDNNRYYDGYGPGGTSGTEMALQMTRNGDMKRAAEYAHLGVQLMIQGLNMITPLMAQYEPNLVALLRQVPDGTLATASLGDTLMMDAFLGNVGAMVNDFSTGAKIRENLDKLVVIEQILASQVISLSALIQSEEGKTGHLNGLHQQKQQAIEDQKNMILSQVRKFVCVNTYSNDHIGNEKEGDNNGDGTMHPPSYDASMGPKNNINDPYGHRISARDLE